MNEELKDIKFKKLYFIYDAAQPETGKWYDEFWVQEGFPQPYMSTYDEIPEELIQPKYVFGTGWIEDEATASQILKKQNEDLQKRLESLEKRLSE